MTEDRQQRTDTGSSDHFASYSVSPLSSNLTPRMKLNDCDVIFGEVPRRLQITGFVVVLVLVLVLDKILIIEGEHEYEYEKYQLRSTVRDAA